VTSEARSRRELQASERSSSCVDHQVELCSALTLPATLTAATIAALIHPHTQCMS